MRSQNEMDGIRRSQSQNQVNTRTEVKLQIDLVGELKFILFHSF